SRWARGTLWAPTTIQSLRSHRGDVSRHRARVRVRVAEDDARIRGVHLVEPMSVLTQDHVTVDGDWFCVSTVKLSVEHHGGKWYETYIFPSNGKKITTWQEVWGQRYATQAEAEAGHA